MKRLNKTLIIFCAAAVSLNAHSQSNNHKPHAEKQMNEQHDSNDRKNHMKVKSSEIGDIQKIGSLTIEHAMTRETPPGTSVGAGYLTITNKGKEPDKLVTLSSKFSDNVQIHEMKMKNNIMSMKQIKAGLIIPAGETVTLQPGGTHLMFMNLQHQLIEGKVMSVTLNFEKAGTIEVKFPVKKAGSHKH